MSLFPPLAEDLWTPWWPALALGSDSGPFTLDEPGPASDPPATAALKAAPGPQGRWPPPGSNWGLGAISRTSEGSAGSSLETSVGSYLYLWLIETKAHWFQIRHSWWRTPGEDVIPAVADKTQSFSAPLLCTTVVCLWNTQTNWVKIIPPWNVDSPTPFPWCLEKEEPRRNTVGSLPSGPHLLRKT